MYEYYRAVLGAVREGLLLVDTRCASSWSTRRRRRLLALPDDVVGRSLGDLGLPPGLVAAIEQRTAVADETYVLGQQVLVFSSAPAYWRQAEVGAVVTVRDRTELQAVTGELDVVRGLTDSLRAQNHEAANRLHTVVSLIEMGRSERAVEFATEELRLAQGYADQLVAAVQEPVLAALLLGKTAEAAERGIDLVVGGDVPAELPVRPRELVTVVGNLVDNAIDAVAEPARRPQRVRVDLTATPGPSRCRGGQRHRRRAGGRGAGAGARLVDQGRGGPRHRARPGRARGVAARRHGRGGRSPLGGRQVRGRGARRPDAREARVNVRVLVVEDEELAAEAHAAYVGRVDGFELAGVARSAAEALRLLARDETVDLVLLDMHLPDGHGLALLQRLRAAGRPVDVIAVTSRARHRGGAPRGDPGRRALPAQAVLVRDLPRQARALRGVPRAAGGLRRRRGPGRGGPGLRRPPCTPTGEALPKGMSLDSLRAVVVALRESPDGLSATEAAAAVGVSRVTARRYLEHLADEGRVTRSPRYGGAGRPEVGYVWTGVDRA